MAKNEEIVIDQQEVVKPKKGKEVVKVQPTMMDDNRRVTELLKAQRKNMDVDALLGKIQTLEAQLKRAQSV